eukprot:10056023-Ditylum_brightwellii.AAC.1
MKQESPPAPSPPTIVESHSQQQTLQPHPYHAQYATKPPSTPSPNSHAATYPPQAQPPAGQPAAVTPTTSAPYYPHASVAAAMSGYQHSPYHSHYLPHYGSGNHAPQPYAAAPPPHTAVPVQQQQQQQASKFPPEAIASPKRKSNPSKMAISPNNKQQPPPPPRGKQLTSPSKQGGDANMTSATSTSLTSSSLTRNYKNAAFGHNFTPLERNSSSNSSSRTVSTVSTISVDAELLMRGSGGSNNAPTTPGAAAAGGGGGVVPLERIDSQRLQWQQQEAQQQAKMSLENLSPPPSSTVLGRQHQQQQQQPQPYHQHQHPPANPHPLRHAYTTMGYRSSGRLSISGGSGSNSSGAGPGNSVRFSKLSDMSVSFNLSASIGLTRSASLPGLRTSGDNTYDKDELCEDSLLLPSRFDEEDEEQVDELLRGVGGASSHIGSWKQASWMTASMNHSRNMSKSDLPGPEFGKCSGGTATTALSSGRGSD